MAPLLVQVPEVGGDRSPGLSHGLVGLKVGFFVLQAAPQAFTGPPLPRLALGHLANLVGAVDHFAGFAHFTRPKAPATKSFSNASRPIFA